MYQSEKINRPLRAGVWYRRPEFLEFLLFGLLFVALTALACFFPMQGDDWAWGSHIGLERLSNSFRNYNGRYLGNLLILALSRSHFLNAVAFALILTLLIYLMQKAGTGLFRSTCLFIPLLFFLMPSTMFRQVFSWASGFVNYVPSMVFVLLFLVIIRRSMQPNAPALTVWRAAFILITGFAGQLFVEHVTLYMVAASLLMLLVCSLIKKKLHVESLLYAISCIAGAAFMFTNGAYLNAITSPGYQEIPSFSLTGWLRDAFHVFLDQISDLLVWDNIVLNLFIALLCLVLLMKTKETKASRRILRDLFASGFVFFISYQVYLTTGLQLLGAYQKYISAIGVIVYFVLLAATALFFINNSEIKWSIIFFCVSTLVITAPLFIVKPIGPRCFFAAYVFLVLIFCEFWQYGRQAGMLSLTGRRLAVPVVCALAVVLLFYFRIYSTVWEVSQQRLAYIDSQYQQGETLIEIPQLPYKDYLWTCDPINELWTYRYKAYYQFPDEISFNLVSYDQWLTDTGIQK